MTHRLSMLISWSCAALLILVPIASLFLLFDLGALEYLIQKSQKLPIRWDTISDAQWYSFWALSALYVSIGLVGIFFLRRAFASFARGELFNLANSRDIKRFSIFLLAQTLLTPVHYGLSSILLSLNHPAGQKVLVISFGSNELKAMAVALIFWVVSNLLVEANKLQAENQQFI